MTTNLSVNLKIETNILSSGDVEVFEYDFVSGRVRLIGSKTFSSAQLAVEYIQARVGGENGAQKEES